MYFSAYQSRKRDRSPPSDAFATPCNSPAIGLVTSPTVDVLAKRQRTGRSIGGVLEQIEVQDQHLPALQYEARANGNASNSNGNGLANGNGHERELDMSMQYAEKRRARQWEQLNAPQPVSPLFKTSSHPPPGIYDRLKPDNEDLGYFSPAHAHHAQKPARPQFKHHMSSSPIRHQPPGSSPFKSSGPSSQATARDFRSSGPISAESEDEDEEMDQEELRRDWGEHYARPNGLLLSLHRSRQSQPRVPTTPHNHHSDNMLSSPFTRPASSRAHSYRDEHDLGYEVGEDARSSPDGGDATGEVDNQYEETNRLLGQLELVRRQRLGTE